MVPGVFLYAASFFCIKFAVYGVFLNIHQYLQSPEIGYSKSFSATVESCFDVGAILGSIVLGYLSDKIFTKRSPVAFFSTILSVIIVFVLTFKNQVMS